VARDAGAPAAPVLQGLRERLSDDLDSPGAIALVDAWAAETLAGGPDQEEESPRVVCDAVDALLGVALDPSAQGRALDPSARGRALDPSARGRALDPSARGRALDPSARGRALDPSARDLALGGAVPRSR
jgi:hypothetical protein